MKIIIIGSIILFISCNKVVKNENVLTPFTDNQKSEFNTIGEIVDYSATIIPDKNYTKNQIKNIDFLKKMRSFIFFKNKRLFPITDTFGIKDGVCLNFDKNKINASSLILRNVNEDYIYFIFLFDSSSNSGFQKNGFYLHKIKENKTLFFKCLANDLPFSRYLKFNNMSTIAVVDSNLVEETFFIYDKLLLSHVGVYDYNNKNVLNIGLPLLNNSLDNVTLKKEISIDKMFNMIDSTKFSNDLMVHYTICNKNIQKREVTTYKWLIGYNNNDFADLIKRGWH